MRGEKSYFSPDGVKKFLAFTTGFTITNTFAHATDEIDVRPFLFRKQ